MTSHVPGRSRTRLVGLMAAALLAAACSGSGGSDGAAARPSTTATPARLGERVVPLSEYDGLTEGTPIERSPTGKQVSLLALASDGVALLSVRSDRKPDSVDGVFQPVGRLELVHPDGRMEQVPGPERAVDNADIDDRYVVWTEATGEVSDGQVSLTGRSLPGWALQTYDRASGKVRTLVSRDPAVNKGGMNAPEFMTPLLVGDRVAWTEFRRGEQGATVFSAPLDGSQAPRREAQNVQATASDGNRLWYTVITQAAAGRHTRIAGRDLASGDERVAFDAEMESGQIVGALAAAAGMLVWSVDGQETRRLVISDGDRIVGELATDTLAWRALHVTSRLVGYGDSPDAESDNDGQLWLLDRERKVIVALGGSCCPRVLVAGPHVIWDDGTEYRRAVLK